MNWKYIFNPFEKFDEKTLLIVGISIYIIVNLIAYFSGSKLDGIMHFDSLDEKNVVKEMLLSFGVIAVSTVLIFILGKIFNRRTRLIDIVNMILISLFPTILILLIGEIPVYKTAVHQVAKLATENSPVIGSDLIIVLLFTFLLLPFLIYNIVLLYNGFKTATNTKKWQHIAIFFAFIFILNTITQILI
ncbi:Yip1 domain [Chryseobacterium taklimakanense]|uniref:Yip1 domain n=1 Tax=Chryseobacterium taklimakanense TaxID=536441 RepID=A0A239XUP8_9FLAO|nr:YIP1 family protein [Chryseobacterium taklimakanense]SNV50140.1 Yip1 domain [Chryseobacterium taklimakanense]